MVKRNFLAIIQARYDSYRLPGKICKKIVRNLSVIEIIISRLRKSKKIDQIIVSTSNNINDKKIIKICKKLKIRYFIGSENDVLDRFYKTALKFKAKNILRITGDCPIVDPVMVDKFIEKFDLLKPDY